MQIIRVQMENLRSYREALVEFVEGVNAIVGANGAGKSTVLSAIGLALFNTRPPGIVADGLVREGANSATVTVEFESALDGRRYEVERRLGTTARFRVYDVEMGKAVVAEGVADVEGWLRQHLGIGVDMSLSDLFENTIGVYQGTFTAPFLLTAAQRKGIFDPLLRVDEYARAVDALREPRRLLSEQDQALSVRQSEIKGMLSALPGLRDEAAALERRLAQSRVELVAARQAQSEAEASNAAWQARREAVDQARRARDRAASAVDSSRQLLALAREALQRAQAASERIAATAPGYQRYVEAERQRSQLEVDRQRRDQAQAELARVEKRLAAQSVIVKTCRERWERLAERAQRARELEPLAQRQAELEVARDVARERVLQRQHAIKRRDDLQRQVDDQQKQLERLTAQVAEGERVDAERAMAQARLDALQREAEQRQSLLGQARAQQDQLRKQVADLEAAEGAQCPLCEAPLTEEHRAELLERNGAAIATLEAELAALAGAAQEAESERARLRADLQKLDTRRRTLAGPEQVHTGERSLSDLQQRAQEAQEQVAALGAPDEDARQAQEALAVLGNPAQELAVCRAELQQRGAAEDALDEAETTLGDLEAQQQAAWSSLTEFADLGERLGAVEVLLRDNRGDYDDYVSHQREAAEVSARVGRVDELAAAFAAQQEALAAAEAELATAAAEYDAELDRQAQQALLRAREAVATLTARLESDDKSLAGARAEIERLEVQQAEEARIIAERARVADAARLIEWTRGLLREAGPLVTQQLVRRISADAASLFSELMDNYAARLAWSENYALTLDVAGRERDFAQLSGGEQMCAALALRLALLRNLSGIDVAFFDEPTAHLDAERRALLAHTLTQVQGFKQIFVISHDSTFEQAAQAYFEVTKDGNGSHIERV